MPADYEELVRECTSAADLDSRAGEPCGKALRKAATAISELLAERGGCDPDGCKEHIDAFMRRAEAAEAERDAMAVQLAAATNPEYASR